MHTTCHVCLAPLGDPVLDTRSPFSLTSLCLRHAGPTLVHLCTACGHAQTPVMDDVEAYYDQSYRILLASEDEDQVVDMAGDRPVYRTPLQLDTLLRRVALPDGAGVLDYGCAKASTLRALLQRRPDLAGHVFDVSEMYRPFWQRFLPAERCAAHDLPRRWAGSFDLVTSFFAFEHIVDVRAAVRTVRGLLRPGGVFHCVVPNPLTNTGDFVVVDHVQHFTAASLYRLLDEAGFEVAAVDGASHRGAWTVVARKPAASFRNASRVGLTPDEPSVRGARRSVQASCDAVREAAAAWQSAADRLRAFENGLPTQATPAVYGASFYGNWIAANLREPQRVHCFLDRNPFQQGRALHERPVMAPEALPREVDTVYVGLNPAHARASVGDLASLAGRPLSFFYL